MGEVERTNAGSKDNNYNLNMKEMTMDDVKLGLASYKYALIYGMSEVLLCPISANDLSHSLFDTSLLDNCIEAYIFDEKRQIHLYRKDDILVGISCEEIESCNNYIDKKYELSARFAKEKKDVIIREYYETDDDGQIRVAYVRLVDLV